MAEGFTGEYTHSIDTKGRIIVPAKFKKILGDTPVVSLGIDGCLDIFTKENWEEQVAKLNSLPSNISNIRMIKRVLMGNAAECEVDKQGRILIPQRLREKAGIEKEAVFVGVGQKIELWSSAKYETEISISSDDLKNLADALAEYNISF